MTTLARGSDGKEPPLRTRSCPLCAALWPAALVACPNDATPLDGPDAATAFQLEPGARVSDYVITGCIGQGGMATVYAATHPLIGKKVAIKVMAPHLCVWADAVERFLLEARAVNQIAHPNIVDVFT